MKKNKLTLLEYCYIGIMLICLSVFFYLWYLIRLPVCDLPPDKMCIQSILLFRPEVFEKLNDWKWRRKWDVKDIFGNDGHELLFHIFYLEETGLDSSAYRKKFIDPLAVEVQRRCYLNSVTGYIDTGFYRLKLRFQLFDPFKKSYKLCFKYEPDDPVFAF